MEWPHTQLCENEDGSDEDAKPVCHACTIVGNKSTLYLGLSHQQISVVLLLFAISLTSVSFDMDDDTARAFRHEQCMNEGMSPDIDRPLLYFSWPPACDLWHPSKGCAVSRIERLLNFSSGEVEGLQGNLDPDTRQTLLFKSLRQEFAPRRHLKRVAGANYDDTMRFATK
jgi:hypothetical protein